METHCEKILLTLIRRAFFIFRCIHTTLQFLLLCILVYAIITVLKLYLILKYYY